MSRKKTDCVNTTRHKHGYHATRAELDAIVDIVRVSKMDESWFGEIVEAKARDGNVVHVVHDLESGSWLSLKYAVKLVYEGTMLPFDYVTIKQAIVFEKLLYKLGIVPKGYNDRNRWYARIASKHRRLILDLMASIIEADSANAQFRPMKIKRRKSGVYFLDIGDVGAFPRSVCYWFCCDKMIPFDAWCERKGKKALHFVSDGRKFCLPVEEDECKLLANPEDIVARGGDNV